jgi:hypothetical protein
MLVTFDVDSLVLQLEAHVVATFIAWRKGLAVNARYFMRLTVLHVVNDHIDAGGVAFLSRLKNISNFCHNWPPCCSSGLLMEESHCAGSSSMSGFGAVSSPAKRRPGVELNASRLLRAVLAHGPESSTSTS